MRKAPGEKTTYMYPCTHITYTDPEWYFLQLSSDYTQENMINFFIIIIFNLDTQSDNPKKQLKFSACKFLPSAKYLGMFREELIGRNKKKRKKKRKEFQCLSE